MTRALFDRAPQAGRAFARARRPMDAPSLIFILPDKLPPEAPATSPGAQSAKTMRIAIWRTGPPLADTAAVPA